MTPVEPLIEAALTAHGEGRTDEAFDLYGQALADRPDYLHISNLPGDATFDRPRRLVDDKLLDAVIERLRYPKGAERNAKTLTLLGGFYQLSGDASAAVSACQSSSSSDVETAVSLGLAYLDLHEFDAAVAVLSDAVVRHPGNVRLLNYLGGAHRSASNFDAAIDSFRLASRPEFLVAMANLGSMLREARRYDDAIKVLQQVLGHDSAFPKAAYNLCMAYMATGQDAEAVVAGQRGVADGSAPDFEDYNGLGSALLAHDDYAAALVTFEKSLSLNPRGVTALAMINGAWAGLGRGDDVRNLVDFGRFMMPFSIQPPSNFRDLAAFNDALFDHAMAFPEQPGNGRQTLNLVATPHGPMVALKQIIDEAVAGYIAQFPDGLDHPFTAYKPQQWDLDVWATRMTSVEYQFPHIHPHGWVSGIYYPRVPEFTAPLDHKGQVVEFPGHIEFYRFLQFSQRPIVSESVRIPAEEGLMVLFPSYFHHTINPFESETMRMSIAFNAMPR